MLSVALPVVTISLSKRMSSTGDLTVTVTCTVSGRRPLTVTMLLDGSEKNTTFVNNTETETDVVFQTMSVSVGSIVQCVLSNRIGSSQTSQLIDAIATGMGYHFREKVNV